MSKDSRHEISARPPQNFPYAFLAVQAGKPMTADGDSTSPRFGLSRSGAGFSLRVSK